MLINTSTPVPLPSTVNLYDLLCEMENQRKKKEKQSLKNNIESNTLKQDRDEEDLKPVKKRKHKRGK